jgi:methionyl-tRNA formyltransferase
VNIVLVTNNNLNSLLSTHAMLREYGLLVTGIVITTKLPSQKSNWIGLWDMLRTSGMRYTYYKVLMNRLLPWRIARTGCCVSVTDYMLRLGHQPKVITCDRADDPHIMDQISALQPDLLLSAGATHKFKEPLLAIPKQAPINLHTSLLPKFAGVDPQFWALQKGEKQSGVTCHITAPKLDSGHIVHQLSMPLAEVRSVLGLVRGAWELGNEVLTDILSGQKLIEDARPQNLAERTFFRKPRKADVEALFSQGLRFYDQEDVEKTVAYAKRVTAIL